MDIDKLEKEKHSLSFEKYLTNPSGNKGNLFLNMSMVKGNLNEKFDSLLREKKNKFDLKVYDNGNKFILYVKVPSSKYDLFYDVVFEIDKKGEDDKPLERINLKKSKFKVYSNCPSFVFTYAFIFNNRELLIEGLKSKYSKDTLQKQPLQKNYYQIVAMEKSLFFAISYILMQCSTLEEVSNKAVKGNCFSLIATPEGKLAEYRSLQKQESVNKTKDRKKEVRKEALGRVLNAKTQKGDTKRIITGKAKITGNNSKRTTKKKGKSKIK